MEVKLKNLRIIHGALLISVPIYIFLIEWAHRDRESLKRAVLITISCIVAYIVLSVFSFRARYLSPAIDKLRLQRTDAGALQQWRLWSIVIFMMSESVVLWGVVVRIMGGSLSQAAPFYAGGLLLLLLSTPRRP